MIYYVLITVLVILVLFLILTRIIKSAVNESEAVMLLKEIRDLLKKSDMKKKAIDLEE